MFVLEYKLRGKPSQYQAIDEAIRTVQFVRNKCLRYWEDNKDVGQKATVCFIDLGKLNLLIGVLSSGQLLLLPRG